jgi:hypothetical protein
VTSSTFTGKVHWGELETGTDNHDDLADRTTSATSP